MISKQMLLNKRQGKKQQKNGPNYTSNFVKEFQSTLATPQTTKFRLNVTFNLIQTRAQASLALRTITLST
jgi:hypothetical protein